MNFTLDSFCETRRKRWVGGSLEKDIQETVNFLVCQKQVVRSFLCFVSFSILFYFSSSLFTFTSHIIICQSRNMQQFCVARHCPNTVILQHSLSCECFSSLYFSCNYNIENTVCRTFNTSANTDFPESLLLTMAFILLPMKGSLFCVLTHSLCENIRRYDIQYWMNRDTADWSAGAY